MKKVVLIFVTLSLFAGVLGVSLAQERDELIAQLPEELQALYDNSTSPILPSAYEDFETPEQPWLWCHSESYQGNPWRVNVTNELRRLVDVLKAEGVVSGFELTDSNGDVAQQISHIRAFIDRGCSVITMIPGSATGLDEAIKAAFEAGIPVITVANPVTSPYAINVDENYYVWAYDMMAGICKELGGKGNVLVVEGIAGNPIVAQQAEGYAAALEECPDLKVVAKVNGDWTPTVTKSVVLQALATNPTKIDAVWTSGSESRLVAEAFAEAGRPQPLITGSISGDALGYWKENPEGYRFFGHGVLPHPTAQAVFRVAVRVLSGQNPLLNNIMMPLPLITQADLASWYDECFTPDSGSLFPIPPADRMPDDVMDAYFANGEGTPFYSYDEVPSACELAE
jgi:ribose transport system substrate-binding protein